MLENLIEKFGMLPVKRKAQFGLGLLGLLIVVGVGINTLAAGFLGGIPKRSNESAKPTPKILAEGGTGAGSTQLTAITDANFAYLLPQVNAKWNVIQSSKTYDASKGVAKYNVRLANAGTSVTVSQQVLPKDLRPRESSAFMEFVNANKPTRSLEAGSGTLYYLPALQNGAPAAGADTVIFATDEVLLFGRAERVVGYEGWNELMSAMKPL